MSKKIIATICVVVVLCSCLVVPTFANSNNDVDFSTQPIPVFVMNSTNITNGFYSGSSPFYFSSSIDDTYVFRAPASGYQGFYFASSNSGGTGYGSISASSVWNKPIDQYNSTYDLYYSTYLTNFSGGSQYVNVPSYSSINDALSDIRAHIENESVTTITNNVSVPAGNVAYIKTNGVQVLDLTTTFVQYSQLFSDTWANITQKVSWEASLPSGTVTFPLNGMTGIQWTKSGNTNILGQTQNASASYQSTSNQYFVIYNPLYQQYGQGNNYDMNGTIYVSGEIAEIKVYPLSGSVVTGQGLVSNSDSGYDDYFELQDDGNGNLEWIDQSGNVSSGPQTGGTSLLPQEATIQTLASQILNIITKVGQSIANIFNVGHSAIVTLVGHASEFVSHFQSLYSWLPADIFAVLSSAIILAITIGIIKVFI